MSLPNTIYAGIQRTGSTWLYQYLRDHPQVFVPYIKEVHYFDRNYYKGLEWYTKFFKESKGELVSIDITPNYFHDLSIPGKIKEVIPDCKIIIVLRNPVDFIFSSYKKHRQMLLVKEDFSEIINDQSYLNQAFFFNKMKAYLDAFPLDRLHIDYYENFLFDKEKFISNVTSFLEIKKILSSMYEDIVNQPVDARFKGLHSFLRKVKHISRRNRFFLRLTDFFRPYILNSSWYSTPLNKTISLKPDQAEFLKKYYLNDVIALSELLDFDLVRFWDYPGSKHN
jgi:hypothetical protein